MKKRKLLLIISIFSIFLSSCSFNRSNSDETIEPKPEEIVETTNANEEAEIDNEFTVDYDSYMGKWYIFNSTEAEKSCGEIIFKTDADEKIKISVKDYPTNDNLTKLETLRFISEFTALGEGEITKSSSTKYQFSFKTNDETKEDLCEINIVDKKSKEQVSAPLYLYRVSVRNTKTTVQPEVQTPVKPVEESKPTTPKVTSKKATFEQRASAIESYEATVLENAYSQQEINIATYNVFEKWDALLNDVYQHLKSTLPSAEFNKLKNDEIAWIKEKESAIEEAAADWEGGSGEPMIRNGVATSYTKERCYYLISLVK